MYFVLHSTKIMHIFVSYKEKLYFNQLLSLLSNRKLSNRKPIRDGRK